MQNAVFLNLAKLDFDQQLDFAPLMKLAKVTSYSDSRAEEIIERVADQQIVITKELPVGRDLIEKFPPSVKLIVEAGTGYNNIDIKAAREKGITVCNVPGYSTEAVAQLTITLMLSLMSSLPKQQRMIERKDYRNFTEHLQVPHRESLGKMLGVIGSGTIGRQVIKIALALGMDVLTYNRTPQTWEMPHVRQVSLGELLGQSDVVTIHCPLTPDTKHLINEERLKWMKPTAVLINTARGPIVKEDDLIKALQEGTIAGAALDVQNPEPPSPDNPLFAMDNVILTPHIGWKTLESRQRLIGMMADIIAGFLAGKPVNVVN
ncbi:NAD(P)-dependent oxidoreductase [Heliophilum fasciatum]|uniref:Glycerate dehydrogenase n=1 Tax=Heliophilum fasciatum TaxID=35700 RepID=A0A4R2RVS3_9FIRM|nr:NAD(P)-dependent oxidoreductase [Heliophilum fasciatum]MCW2276952.1 glycerate dehydrogenase [Heliophilum fasciatum]TCP68522.1 glycerate dehydrogenase [Heliophilum fasciatum]